MPVRVGYLYENTYDYDFVKLSIKLALQAKGTDPNTPDGRTVRLIKSDPDKYTRKLCRKMEREEFRPSAPIKQIRYEGINKKKRIVQKPRLYPDHIVHWITIRAIQPVLERGMYEYCCGNIPGRGIAEVRRILTKTLQGKGNYTPEGQVKLKKKGLRYKYCLKMDIHHFYQSINQDLLIEQLHGVIKDPRMMKLLIKIIKSTGPGLPIGYYTSQWLANFHLQELDHYIKEVLKVPLYVRYVDDMVLCDDSKERLYRDFIRIKQYLSVEFGLQLKHDWPDIFVIDKNPIDFCGYRFTHDKTTLRKSILCRARRAARKLEGPASMHDLRSSLSYWGWLEHSDTKEYVKKYIHVTKSQTVQRFKILDKSGFSHEKQLLADLKRKRVDWTTVEPLDSE